MSTLILRSAILVLVGLLTWGIVWSGRRYVERRRRIALAAQPVFEAANSNIAGQFNQQVGSTPVHILVFSSADCHQCHKYQIPALQRVTEARRNQVSVEEIDAPCFPRTGKALPGVDLANDGGAGCSRAGAGRQLWPGQYAAPARAG